MRSTFLVKDSCVHQIAGDILVSNVIITPPHMHDFSRSKLAICFRDRYPFKIPVGKRLDQSLPVIIFQMC
jgi:hypothetical protein